MNRAEEIDHKHDQLRTLLDERRADSLWLRRSHNVSWITAGADPIIDVDTPTAPYSVLITREKRVIVSDNIEYPRLQAEEGFGDLGFEYQISQWFAPNTPTADLTDMDAEIERAVQKCRWSLIAPERERFRALGRDAAAALEEALLAARPGETERQICSRLVKAAYERNGMPTVVLCATDERIAQFRHPYVTDKPLDKYLMLILCMRRGGLIVAATRLAYFGALPDELREKCDKVAAIDAATIAASRPGRTLGEVFAALQAAYAAQGEADQWRNHHQGGLIGYQSREVFAKPDDPTVITAGMAAAWNPSIVGCKSEDTVLLTEEGFEIVTAASGRLPSIEIGIGGQTIRRPAIAELG